MLSSVSLGTGVALPWIVACSAFPFCLSAAVLSSFGACGFGSSLTGCGGGASETLFGLLSGAGVVLESL